MNTTFLVAIKIALSVTCLIGDMFSSTHVKQSGQTLDILKIKIIDRTDLHYYMDGRKIRDTLIDDLNALAILKNQLSSLKEVPNLSVRYNFGFYEIIIYLKNGKKTEWDLVYTVYDGVVIYHEDTTMTYKNNNLEEVVRTYFAKNHNK